MFNEARTRLLNISADQYSPGIVGEPVPDDYVQLNEIQAVREVKQILYGTKPDSLMLDWRTRQLLWFVYASDAGALLDGLDQRLTYDKHSACGRIYPLVTCRNTVTADLAVTTGGEFPPDSSGISLNKRQLTLTGVNSLTVVQQIPSGGTSFLTREADGMFNISPSGLRVRIPEDVGSVWQLNCTTLPKLAAGDLLKSIDSLGEPTHLELFDVGGTRAQELLPAYELWSNGLRVMDRLGAVVAAVILQTRSDPN